MYIDTAISCHPLTSSFTNWDTGGLSEHQEAPFHCDGDQALLQLDQGGCEVSILEDIQKLPGYSSGQPALGGPSWAWGWSRWPLEFLSNLNRSVILFLTLYAENCFLLSSPCSQFLLPTYCHMNYPFINKAEGEKGYRRSILIWINVM